MPLLVLTLQTQPEWLSMLRLEWLRRQTDGGSRRQPEAAGGSRRQLSATRPRTDQPRSNLTRRIRLLLYCVASASMISPGSRNPA